VGQMIYHQMEIIRPLLLLLFRMNLIILPLNSTKPPKIMNQWAYLRLTF